MISENSTFWVFLNQKHWTHRYTDEYRNGNEHKQERQSTIAITAKIDQNKKRFKSIHPNTEFMYISERKLKLKL